MDILNDEILSLSQAAAKLPKLRGGERPHIATLYRWAQRGVRGVRLETGRVGGTLVTSTQALRQFFDALSEPLSAPPADPSEAARAAARELDAEGI